MEANIERAMGAAERLDAMSETQLFEVLGTRLKKIGNDASGSDNFDMVVPKAEAQGWSDVLDFGKPVALMLVAILMYFDPDAGDDPYPVVRRLIDALPSGSYVGLTHPTGDFDPEAMAGVRTVSKHAGITFVPRGRDEIAAFLDGLELVDPGIAPVLAWRPDPQETDVDPHSAYYWAAVARKP